MDDSQKAGATASVTPIKPAKGEPALLRGIVQKLKADFEDYKKAVQQSVNAVAGRATATGEQLMRTFTILGDIETRLETFKTLLIRKDVFTEAEHEATWDEVKGLRVKTSLELIAEGDFVRVSFKATTDDGTLVGEEVDFPTRVGGGHLVIEGALIGKQVGCEPFIHTEKYPNPFPFNPQLAGKTVTFAVSIGKVKTSLHKEKADDRSE